MDGSSVFITAVSFFAGGFAVGLVSYFIASFGHGPWRMGIK